jgi:hypothetical protein
MMKERASLITDIIPRSAARRKEYERSDSLKTLPLPGDAILSNLTAQIQKAMEDGTIPPVKAACSALIDETARFYGVSAPKIRVLASRPVRVYETGSSELFGDYDLVTAEIRIWMRTAVRHQVTSFGTFLSTLCHEFCHHLDRRLLGFPNTLHTRGFYERTAVLYHNCRGTPFRALVWRYHPRGFWQIDWVAMRKPAAGSSNLK